MLILYAKIGLFSIKTGVISFVKPTILGPKTLIIMGKDQNKSRPGG
jgi:hypothetical protein